jgi:exopolysaccharide biosynthesis polyprenyl glycosylphosphotransferase
LLVYTPVVALVDLLLIHAGFFGLLLLRPGYSAVPTLSLAANLAPLLCLLSLVTLNLFDLYTDWLRSPPKQSFYFMCVSALLICATAMMVLDWAQQCRLPLEFLALSTLLVSGLLTLYRLLLRRFYWSTVGRSRVMVLASDEDQAVRLLRKLSPVAPGWMELVGYLIEKDFPSVGETSFDAIVLAPGLARERALVERCAQMRKTVMAVPALMEMSLLRAKLHEMDDLLVVELRSPHLTCGQELMKRLFDLAVATILLVLLSPVLLITAALIRFTSKGPAVFKQDRVGRNGVEYELYKFRTMVVDAERDTGPVFARESDPRITRLGNILRATRIDELPQLVNVLIGNMSLIGPRPERQVFVSAFRETVPDYNLRLGVKPGITGLAQVAGSYSTAVENKLRLDLLYISDYSLMRDIWILLRTILVVFHGERAEGIKAPSSSPVIVEEHASVTSSSHS